MPLTKGPVGLVSAVPFEASLLLGEMKKPRTLGPGVTAGRIGGARVVHMASGVGIANAARAATVLCERHRPSALLLFGIGGAYPGSGLSTGDLALAEREIYADCGVSLGDGDYGFEAMGLPLVRAGRRKLFNEFPLDRGLIRRAMRHLGGARPGPFLTVCLSTGTRARALALERRFSAVCENMEGAAVAQVCAIYGLPLLELRGISNVVEDRDPSKWEKKAASENCQRGVAVLLKSGVLEGL